MTRRTGARPTKGTDMTAEMTTRKTFALNKDPWSTYTHFAGFVAAIVGLVALLVATWGDAATMTSSTIYGVSLALLFLASSAYHFFDLGESGNAWLRRLDHAAIFLLIGGTYVPSFMHLLDGAWRVTMLSVVGGLALLGVLFKLALFDGAQKSKAGTLMYVLLGWIVVIPAYKMYPVIPSSSLAWLVAGGLAYTVGAVVYARKWPDPWPETFGFHEVWHLFVLLGAGLHYGFVFSLLDVPVPPFA